MVVQIKVLYSSFSEWQMHLIFSLCFTSFLVFVAHHSNLKGKEAEKAEAYSEATCWPDLYRNIGHRRKTDTLRNVITEQKIYPNPLQDISQHLSIASTQTVQMGLHTLTNTEGSRGHFDKLLIKNVWGGNINCVWITDWNQMADVQTCCWLSIC